MQFEWLTSISWLNPSSLFSLRFSRQNKSSSSTWCQSLLSLNRMVVRVNVSFEKRGVVWIESWLWRGYLLSSRNSSNLQFLACSCLSKSKWCIWRIVALFHLCCHYEEILNYRHNTICIIIPFASSRTQKRWLNIRWFLGPQQWFYIKNSDRTTQSGIFPFPISLSLIASRFLSDTDTMLALFVNGLMWPFSMMETFSNSGGTWRYWRTYPPCEIDNHNFFEVVGGQSQGFVVRLWWLFSWNESKCLCVDSRHEILSSEELFLLVSLSLSRDEIQAYSIVWW